MINPKYSIIIPHYNIPALLLRCLQSIPVCADIQVIVIDDCSPKVETYQERFPEFFSRPYLEWYSTPYGGSAGRARNIGLQHAKGKWILFVDADDYLVDGWVDIVEKYADSNFDVIHFKAESVDSDTLEQSDRHKERNRSIDAYFAGDVTAREAAIWFTVIWSQMISRKYIEDNHIQFEELPFAEDIMYTAKLACLTNNILITKEILYVVTTRKNGIHDAYELSIEKYIIYNKTFLHYVRYVRSFGVNKAKPFMLKEIIKTYKKYGVRGSFAFSKMLIHEHALFYGFGDYIERKLKR